MLTPITVKAATAELVEEDAVVSHPEHHTGMTLMMYVTIGAVTSATPRNHVSKVNGDEAIHHHDEMMIAMKKLVQIAHK
jgi:hypothetical protein